ncbi:MAG: type III pantothenate kinase [Sphingomonadaceae bacterium]|uniref:type III pantothenate kinase n=1 Tax=Thermaurantiacus sp. TaxID=2820283 RepID=UPI00298F33D8|nr:type III pantothenate kinase [Thermaurantiacus sp.]MCS6986685.1 type III pantothenate kinase [Sphingomonadaceae bacterium]MDW8414052.1 type III pantothenate kinase [Thermaurantiacus sp.]
MLLAIDVGNTNVVVALCEGSDIRHRWRISTDGKRTSDEYGVWLHQLLHLEGLKPADVTSIIIASVVPQTLFNLRQLARQYFGLEPLVAGDPGFDYGIEVRLPNPAEVGADRLVNAVAARALHPGPLVVVDFGTATTFDVVSADGAYEGGVIAPGIHLSMDALYRAAARLPRIAVEPPAKGLGVVGRNTVHAMQSGVFWGYVGLVEGLVQRISAELDRAPFVIATGGLAGLFARHAPAITHVDPDLTIRGLILLEAAHR